MNWLERKLDQVIQNTEARLRIKKREVVYLLARNITLIFVLLLFLESLDLFPVSQYLRLDWFLLLVALINFSALVFYLGFEGDRGKLRKISKYAFLFFLLLTGIFGFGHTPGNPGGYFFLMTVLSAAAMLYQGGPRRQKEEDTGARLLTLKRFCSYDMVLPISYLFLSLLLFFTGEGRSLLKKLGLTPLVDFLTQLTESTPIIPAVSYILIASTILFLAYRLKSGGVLPKLKKTHQFLSKNKLELLTVMALFSLAFLSRLPSTGFTSCFPDNFAMPAVAWNMVENGVFTYHEGILTGFNFNSPSGRDYPRGGIYTLSLVLSFSTFGFTDFAALLPGMIFGSISVVLIYLLGREVANKNVGLVASLVMAFSGWSIAMDTHIRHYVLGIMLFLLSILLYYKYSKTGRNSSYFFPFMLSLSLFLQTDVQAMLPFALIVSLLVLDAASGSEKRTYSAFLKFLSYFLVVLVPLLILASPFEQTETGFIQFAAYHFGLGSWLFVWALALTGSLILVRRFNETRMNILFYASWLTLPYLAEEIGRPLYPRYTAIFFPIFVLSLSVLIYGAVEVVVKNIAIKRIPGSTSRMLLALFATGILIFSSGSFFLPLQHYSKGDVWPDYYDEKSGELVKHPLVNFKQGFQEIMERQFPEKKFGREVAILSDDPSTINWYVNINEETRDPRFAGVWMASYGNLDRWSFERDSENFHPSVDLRSVNISRFDMHTGIPLISNETQLGELVETYEEGYIIFTDFRDRAGALYEYSKNNFDVFSQSDPEIYYWRGGT
jgi:hypothetical protein